MLRSNIGGVTIIKSYKSIVFLVIILLSVGTLYLISNLDTSADGAIQEDISLEKTSYDGLDFSELTTTKKESEPQPYDTDSKYNTFSVKINEKIISEYEIIFKNDSNEPILIEKIIVTSGTLIVITDYFNGIAGTTDKRGTGCEINSDGSIDIVFLGDITLNDNAFYNQSSISKITFCADVTFGSRALRGCANLTSIQQISNDATVSSIAKSKQVFMDCRLLTTMCFRGNVIFHGSEFLGFNATETVITLSGNANFGDGAYTKSPTKVKLDIYGTATLPLNFVRKNDGSLHYVLNEGSNLKLIINGGNMVCPTQIQLTDKSCELDISGLSGPIDSGKLTIKMPFSYFGHQSNEYDGFFKGYKAIFIDNGNEFNIVYADSKGSPKADVDVTLLKYYAGFENFAIPESVVNIAEGAFKWNQSLESITFSSTIKTVGNNAFQGCENLKSVSLSDSLETVGDYVFSECSNMASVTFGDGLKSIGNNAFQGCENLTAISLPDSLETIGASAFSNCSNMASVAFGDGLKDIQERAFSECEKLTKIILPDSLETIGEYAFYNSISLTSVSLGQSVETIGQNAFQIGNQKNTVTELSFPSSLKELGSGAFWGWAALETVVFENNKDAARLTLPSDAFRDCANLEYLYIPTCALKSVADGFPGGNCYPILVDNSDGGTDYKIEDSVLKKKQGESWVSVSAETIVDLSAQNFTKIDEGKYSGQRVLEEIRLPATVMEIESRAFLNCISLKKVIINGTISGITVGEDAFSGCTSLESIQDKNGNEVSISGLSQSAFKNCSKYGGKGIALGQNIGEIPDSCFEGSGVIKITNFGSLSKLETIGKNAFKNSALTEATLPDGLKQIGHSAFSGSHISSINLPANVDLELVSGSIKIDGSTHHGENQYYKLISPFTDCSELKSITVEEGSKYSVSDSCLLDANKHILVIPEGIENVVIPNGASFLDELDGENKSLIAFFERNSQMRSIDLSKSGITELPTGLFYGCTELHTIILKNTTTVIGDYAFAKTEHLESVDLKDCTLLTSIGKKAFSETGLTEIEIASVNGGSIKEKAFYGNQNLTSVTVGSGWSIGGYAFGDIRSAVTIDFTSSPSSINDNSFYGTTSLESIRVGGGTPYSTDSDNVMLFRTVEEKKELVLVASSAESITLPSDVTGFTDEAFSSNLALTEILVEEGNTVYSSSNGMLLQKEGDAVKLVHVPRGISTIVVPSEVTQIEQKAFRILKSGDREIRQSAEELIWGDSSTKKDISFVVDSIVNLQLSALRIQTEGSINVTANSISFNVPHIELIGNSVTVDEGVKFGTSVQTLKVSDESFRLGGHFHEYTNVYANAKDDSGTHLTAVSLEYALFDVTIGEKHYSPAEAFFLVTGYSIEFKGDLAVDPEFYTMSLRWVEGSDSKVHPAMLRFSATTESGHIPDNMILTVDGREIEFRDGMYTVEFTEDNTVLVFSEKPGVTKHTVTFSYGSQTETADVLDGQAIPAATLTGKTENHTKDGYTLYGWYTDENFKTAYNFGAIRKDTTLYAKWTLMDGVEVFFGIGGYISATMDGKYLFNGEKVEKGSEVAFSFYSYDRELKGWIVNGRAIESTDISIQRTIQERTEIQADTRHFSAYGEGMSDVEAPIGDMKELWAFKNKVDTSMLIWSGFPTIPLTVDDSVYFRAGDTLYRIDALTGDILDSVYTEGSTIVAYYIYIGYGDGTILDYATGNAYDLELNDRGWDMPKGTTSAFYGENGYFYGIADGMLSKFSSEDGKVVDKWSVDVSGWHNLYGTTSKPVVLNGKAYYVDISGNNRGIGCIDLDDGTKETVVLSNLSGMLLDDGWLTTSEVNGTDYLFLTAYGKGLFDEGDSSTGAKLFAVRLDKNGGFSDDCERFMTFSQKSSGCASAFIVFNGRGYVNINGQETGEWGTLYTIDVERFIDTVYGNEWNLYKNSSERCYSFILCKQDSTYTHGSIVVNTAYYESTGSVYIYMLPYNPSGTMVLVFEDHEGKVRDTGHTEIKGNNAYGSQTVRIGSDGVLVWYDDSGTVYCYASASMVPYRFLIQNADGAEWVFQKGTDALDALRKALAIKGWNTDVSKLHAYVKNSEGQIVPVTDLTDKAVSNYREFLISTDIADINDIPERMFYLYKTDGTADAYDILRLFDDSSVKGKLTVDGFSRILIHAGDEAEWVSVDGSGTIGSLVNIAMKKAGLESAFDNLTYNIYVYRDGCWQKVADSNTRIIPNSDYFVSAIVDDTSDLPSDLYYGLDEKSNIIHTMTLSELMAENNRFEKYTTTPIYEVTYDLNGGKDNGTATAMVPVLEGKEYVVPTIEQIQKTVSRNNYVIKALLVNGVNKAGEKITIEEDTRIVISWEWKVQDKKVNGIGLSPNSDVYLIYEGSGYGSNSVGANSGIKNFHNGFEKSDVADKTLFVVYSQYGIADDCKIVGNLYCNGKVIYSEELGNSSKVWYITIGPSPNFNKEYGTEGVLESVVGNSKEFVMEVTVGGITAVRAIVNISDAGGNGNSNWVEGTPEIHGYCGLDSDGSIKEGSSVVLKPRFYPADAAQTKVNWTSSDPSVATVDKDGKVTAVSMGEATIIGVTEDGGYVLSCAVKVVAAPLSDVSIEPASATLNIGDKEQLKVMYSSGAIKTIRWESSDNSIVMVDGNGVIEALSSGVAVITAKIWDNAGSEPFSVTVKVTVAQRPDVPIEKVNISADSIVLGLNDSTTLIASVTPSNATNKDLIWTVSGSAVRVDNGNVVAVSAGTAIIKVSAKSDASKFAECRVTVKDYSVKTIEMSSSAKIEVGKTLTLEWEVTPDDAKNKNLTWTTSNPDVATVVSGVVTAISPGTAIITASAKDGSGVTATCVITVTDAASKVESVALDRTSLTMDVGDKEVLRATIVPNITGLELVCSVESGGTGEISIQKNNDGSFTVMAKKAGSATLTVTVKGTQVSASCEIVIVSKDATKVSEETKKNDDGTSTTTTVEEIETGKGTQTTKTTEVVKDSNGDTKGTKTEYVFETDDINTKTTVTLVEDGNGNVQEPKVEVEIGSTGIVSNGTRSISVDAGQLKEALRQLDRAKAVTGIDDLDKNIEIKADEGKDVGRMVATLDASSISNISGSDDVALTIHSEIGRIEINSDVFSAMEDIGGKATITLSKADGRVAVPEVLVDAERLSLYQADLTVGGKDVHDLKGTISLSLPFSLSEGQDASKISVRYIKADGSLSDERFQAVYEDGMVSFATTHFSTFAVVYGEVEAEPEVPSSTSGTDSSMTSLCIILAALTGGFSTATVMLVLRAKGKI